MVFYKDLNERFISENPANTVSERSHSPLSTRKPIPPPNQAESFHLAGRVPSRQGQETGVLDPALCSLLSGATFPSVQSQPCSGAAHGQCQLPLKQSRRGLHGQPSEGLAVFDSTHTDPPCTP